MGTQTHRAFEICLLTPQCSVRTVSLAPGLWTIWWAFCSGIWGQGYGVKEGGKGLLQSEHLTCFVGQGREIRLFTDQYPGHCHICGSFKEWAELRVTNQNISGVWVQFQHSLLWPHCYLCQDLGLLPDRWGLFKSCPNYLRIISLGSHVRDKIRVP